MREVGRRIAGRTARVPALLAALAVAALLGAGLAAHSVPSGHVLATGGTIIVEN
jgi:hypothetical protein